MDDDDSDDDGIPDDGNKDDKNKTKKRKRKNVLTVSGKSGKLLLRRGRHELPSHVEWPPNDLVYVVTEKVDLLVFPLKYDNIDDAE